jgi:hypothetical protein
MTAGVDAAECKRKIVEISIWRISVRSSCDPFPFKIRKPLRVLDSDAIESIYYA